MTSEAMQNAVSLLTSLREKAPDGILLVQDKNGLLESFVLDSSKYIENCADLESVEQVCDAAFCALSALYEAATTKILTRFQDFIGSGIDPGLRSSVFYPQLQIYVRDPRLGGPTGRKGRDPRVKNFYGYVTDEGIYETTITRPRLYADYYRRQIRELLINHQPVIRVRAGNKPIPIHFAIDANEEREIDPPIAVPVDKITMAITEVLPRHFDVPKLSDIKDVAESWETQAVRSPSLDYINEHHFRLKASEQNGSCDRDILNTLLQQQRAEQMSCESKGYWIHPLALFDADRVDYSLGRIKHYTKTSPSDFQNVIMLTNYQMYIDEFLTYGVSALLLNAVSSPQQSEYYCFGHDNSADILGRLRRELPNLTPAMLKRTTDVSVVIPTEKASRRLSLDSVWIRANVRVVDANTRKLAADETLLEWSESEMKACIRAAVRSVYPEAADQPLPNEEKERDDKLLRSFSNRIVKRFVQGNMTEGMLGPKSPQMPAYHIVRPRHAGISIVNIGVSPSNAKTITDHLAVLRSHVFVMLGHCAGLRSTQRLGHYVLASGYVRVDHVLDHLIKPAVEIPPVREVNDTIRGVCARVIGQAQSDDGDYEISPLLRTGTVATVSDRNWELNYPDETIWPIESGKCIGLDMESATVAGNGFRLSVPYATFLCVSDRPLHGDLKMEGMADTFYRGSIKHHFQIGIWAMEELCEKYGRDGVSTRQLRASHQPPFK